MKHTAVGTVTAVLLVILLAGAALAGVTRGFSAVTSDDARRVDLQRSPRSLPAIRLIDQAEQKISLADYAKPSKYITFVALVYVRCQTVCRTSASAQAFLQHEIVVRGLQDRVRLLTLSFDPFNDSPQVLARYARDLGVDPALWKVATLADSSDLATLLHLFNLVVISDGLGGYSHNAALFQIDTEGKLARAYDPDRPDLALLDYLRQARQ